MKAILVLTVSPDGHSAYVFKNFKEFQKDYGDDPEDWPKLEPCDETCGECDGEGYNWGESHFIFYSLSSEKPLKLVEKKVVTDYELEERG